ncbi:MAG: nickel pincer cofactor biosynthesis protein LarC [Gammaproteobacteria bacterium]|nr:nickel pincer cofactor biosynthesis protein LarC [Gammaproteobacteria bacterium]
MPKALLYECFSGMAGDMHLGAMLDLGVPQTHLQEQLSKLELDNSFRLKVSRGKKLGITGTSVTVELTEAQPSSRHLSDIKRIIAESSLSANVKNRATSMFELLGNAEAQVHDIPIDQVHFHEVGAVDAIVDIVGAAICLDYLNPDMVYCGGVELGSGMVKCAHGLFPVPAPATALLLTDCPTQRGNVAGEATTPTGATVLRHAVSAWENPTTFRAQKTAYGVGKKDFERPNVVRVSVGEINSLFELDSDIFIECNVDDMTPEAYEPLSERLFELGAKDVFYTPIVMKKSRPGTKLSVLAAPEQKDAIIRAILQHSTTIGVRSWLVEKTMLPRRMTTISTSLGDVRVKIVDLPDGSTRWKAEHDDVSALARQFDMSYLDVRRVVDGELVNLLQGKDGY